MAMKSSSPWTAVLFVLALGGALPSAATAATVDPGNGKARTFLASLGERAIEVAQDEMARREDKEARMRALLREGFDLKTLARFVLGKHWRKLDKGQRKDFLIVFEDAMVRQTLTNFGRYSGETFDIIGAGPDRTNPKLIAIKVDIKRADGTLLAKVNWRLRKVGEDFKVVDIVAEGVSMALTLRQEYDSVIQNSKGDVDRLIEKLRRNAAWQPVGDEAGPGRQTAAP